ncbi:hypothetical protein STAFG_0123 [Streptomyces afghaniensis 772]|uniref:Uncharacterized protein n=1 Tax=Streptomyces afghaniensis 772 TaxID=1283301 RepID=S4MZV7_9ACTN|nr:hypothetical protein STAFG_0123 [Streptomyces afghaniensis 772]
MPTVLAAPSAAVERAVVPCWTTAAHRGSGCR